MCYNDAVNNNVAVQRIRIPERIRIVPAVKKAVIFAILRDMILSPLCFWGWNIRVRDFVMQYILIIKESHRKVKK